MVTHLAESPRYNPTLDPSMPTSEKCRVSAQRIIWLKKKLNIQYTELQLKEVDAKLDKAYLQYKVARKNDYQLRQTFLEGLAQAKADAGQKDMSRVLRDMQHREQLRGTFRRILYKTK